MADTLSLRDELKATYEALSADPDTTPPAGEAPPVSANEAPGAAGAEAGAAPEAAPDPAKDTSGQERDENGRFKAKAETPAAEGASAQPLAEPKSETAKPVEAEPQAGAIRVPPSLPAPIKAKFAGLDPDVQQAFVALEESVQTAKGEWAQKGQRLNRYDEIIGPNLDRWRLAGLDEFSGIQSLIAAQSLLDRNPVDGIAQIARSYGLTPAHIAQAFGLTQTSAPQPGSEGQSAPTAAPDYSAALQGALAPLVQQVQTLQQQFTQQSEHSQAAKLAEAHRSIEAFAADPANMYFENVKDGVFQIISADRQAGGQMTLKEAYDRAVWADPSIRPLLIADQAKAAAAEDARKAEEARKAAEKAARDKAAEAARAAGSVTGSPTPGSGPPPGAPRPLREELAANYAALNQI